MNRTLRILNLDIKIPRRVIRFGPVQSSTLETRSKRVELSIASEAAENSKIQRNAGYWLG
jgi:hypothetical protein